MSLGTVLVVVALLATAGLAISGVSVTHLNLMAQNRSARQAENLARSVVAQAVEEVLSDSEHNYGEDRLASESLDISLSGVPEGSTARLTFNPEKAREWGIPYSTNNISNDRSIEGDGRSVPASALHLYGVGESGGKKRVVEVLLHVPALPYSIASAGAIEARNGLIVGSLDEIPSDGDIPTPDQLGPADIHSNSSGTAIVLGRQTRIGGDVTAVGKVDPLGSPSVLIMGEMLNDADPVELPELDLSDYDPELRSGSFDSYNDGRYSDLSIPGAAKSFGDLEVTSGGLHLDGGLLFVDGSLKVTGGLSGKGILVVTGTLTVDGAARASRESQLAILVGRDFHLQGRGAADSYFQGLVYTGGDFFADSATLVGALVSRGETDLKDARFFLDGGEPVTIFLGEPEEVRASGIMSINLSDGQHTYDVELSSFNDEEVTYTIKDNGNFLINTTFTTSPSQIEADLANLSQGLNTVLIVQQRLLSMNSAIVTSWLQQLAIQETSTGTEPTTVDPSKFFKLKDRIRVASWQER
jgi:hypothetical protein